LSATEQKALAERLRRHILTCPDLPVSGGAFSLDGLDMERESMSLQMNEGKPVKIYVDGSRLMRQPFTIYYRAATTEVNEEKSAMMGCLNSIGDWMDDAGPPDLGQGFTPGRFEQITLASIAQQESDVLVYLAAYMLEYEVG
jgi:hypothetical protein